VKWFRRTRRAPILLALAPLVVVAAGLGVSLARTELLRGSFERQVWADGRYPNAELLGAWVGVGDLVQHGLEGPEDGAPAWPAGGECDFVAQGVYGTGDDYERVEAHYRRLAVSIGTGPPVEFDVRPVAAAQLEADAPVSGTTDAATRDLLRRTGTSLGRAATFPTVYTVEVVSTGHAAWLDWRCR
jgi:hypothetical protein